MSTDAYASRANSVEPMNFVAYAWILALTTGNDKHLLSKRGAI